MSTRAQLFSCHKTSSKTHATSQFIPSVMILMISRLSSVLSSSSASDLASEDEEVEVEVGYLSDNEGLLLEVAPPNESGLERVEVVSQPMKASLGSSSKSAASEVDEAASSEVAPVNDTEEELEGEEDEGGRSKLLPGEVVSGLTMTPTVSNILALEMGFELGPPDSGMGGLLLTSSRSLSVLQELDSNSFFSLALWRLLRLTALAFAKAGLTNETGSGLLLKP